MKLIPKNWDNFQHYKHRSPPWIKLHKNLLDDMQYQRLPVASKALAPMLWLLASESNDGVIHRSAEEIAFRLRMTEKEVISAIKPLIDNGFFIEDSNMLAESLQDATTEKRQSRDRDRERDRVETPSGVIESVFKDYLEVRKTKKAKWTETALKGLTKEAEKAGLSLQEAMELCCARGWVGFKAEWIKDQDVAKPNNDKQWMFSDAGIVAKAAELGVHSIGLTYPQLKEKCLLMMAKKAMA
jgi:hypothetical protein